MDETMYNVIELETDHMVARNLNLEEAADLVQLNPEDIEWAVEKHGVCATDVHRVEPV